MNDSIQALPPFIQDPFEIKPWFNSQLAEELIATLSLSNRMKQNSHWRKHTRPPWERFARPKKV